MAGQDANQNSLVAQRLDKLDAQIKENAEHLKEARAVLLDSNSKVDVGIRQQLYNDLVAVQKELMAHLDKLSAHLCTGNSAATTIVDAAAIKEAAVAAAKEAAAEAIHEVAAQAAQAAVREVAEQMQVLAASSLPKYKLPRFGSRKSSASTSTTNNLGRDDKFKERLVECYPLPELDCMVLAGMVLAGHHKPIQLEPCAIVGGHIWPVEHAAKGSNLLTDNGEEFDVNSTKNGIRWLESFEKAYTAGAVAIGVDDFNRYYLVVLCQNWAQADLWSNLGAEAQKALRGSPAEAQLRAWKFDDFQGAQLHFGDTQLRPWKRTCLSWARHSHYAIVANGSLSESAQEWLHLLSLDRISDYGARKRVIAWLDKNLPVSAPQPRARPRSIEPGVPSKRAPAPRSMASSGASSASQKQQANRPKLILSNNLFSSAMEAISKPPPPGPT